MANDPNKDADITLLEHEYDGIREYDQKLPNWWLLTLYFAIIFAIGYWFFYHIADGQSDIEKLTLQMDEIERIRLESSIDITNRDLFWDMASNSTMVAEGQELYMTSCTVCHGTDMKAIDPNTGMKLVGVNLVDNEWIHGHLPENIYNTIYYGVPEKGMQAWGTQLGQARIVKVVAYILSQHGERTQMETSAKPVEDGI